jgi:hypothetical protein
MSGKTYLRNQNFFKRNYFEALKYILPGYLYEDDVSETPKSEDPIDVIINSHIDIADNFSSILNVSTLDSFSGISPYFIKQNELTNITTQSFEDKVLSYFEKTFKGFESQDEFSTYVEDTLLSAIELNNPDTTIFSSVGSASDIHSYLITNLSWMYFLNTSGATYSPSAYVKDLLVNNLFYGKPIQINDGINGLSEHVWKNGLGSYYPSSLFASGTRSDLSGTQQLDKLKTWNDIIYSPLFADKSDFRVRDKFETYSESNLKSSNKIENGPFARLIRALSFFAFDVNNDSEQISTIYDIDDCPDDYLPLVAQLIGWDLFGKDPSRWRLQLRNAVAIYKAVGTKKSIQSTVNTVFPKNRFPIESRITELWESYVPYLIYYALATESPYFKSFESWTPSLAFEMGVEKYSTSSMDDNIRLAVDKIILDTIRQFPDQFPLTEWLESVGPSFNYRGREYPIPPFEEYPYYVNTELGAPQIAFIADRLACFGVRQEFALDVSSYITSNAITDDLESRVGSWLIFTSGYNSPPNLDNLLRNLNDNRFDYASLWSGKSSHFKLILQATEFNFDKKGLDDETNGDALDFIAQSINKMAPAHSIPLVTLEVSAPPDSLTLESSCLPHVYLDREEIEVAAGNNTFASGIFLNTYKREINTGGNVIGRSATESLVSPELINVSSIGAVSRNTARRRSYEKIMPFNGYYDRTGFNMPVGFDMASGLSGIPLGLVPSSLAYHPVSDYINLPAIWSQCEGLSSNNSYYEYDVSNTQNVRGQYANFQANTDRTTDRGQLPGIYAAMHRISENQKSLRSLINIEASTSALESYLSNLELALSFEPEDPNDVAVLVSEIARIKALLNGDYQSYTASATNNNVDGYTFPASVVDYYNFEFGRDLHRLYKEYQTNFDWHRLSPDVQTQDGANIFSHTFGPLLYNHGFESISNENYVTTSLTTPALLNVTSIAFTGAGSFVASSSDSMYLDTFERVSSGIVEGVELVLTSGTEDDSSFSVIKVPTSERSQYEDPFLYGRTFIMMRSGLNAATRLRFDISKYDADSTHPISKNFLTPDHEFKLDFDSLISNDTRTLFGGRSVNVWIHTKPEDGKMWSYNTDGNWIQHTQLPTRQDVIQKYSHSKLFPTKTRDPQFAPTAAGITLTFSNRNLECIDQVTNLPGSNQNSPSPLIGITEEDFTNFTVRFDTRNRDIRLPDSYLRNYGKLHRKDQEYVIEVFVSPGGQPDSYMLLDKVEVQDITMKKLSEIFAAGTKSDPLCVLNDLRRGCLEYRVDLTKQDLFDVFKHFNNIAGKNAATAYASRDKAKTETIMESEGGSRIDYRYVNDLADVVYVTALSNNIGINTITFDI